MANLQPRPWISQFSTLFLTILSFHVLLDILPCRPAGHTLTVDHSALTAASIPLDTIDSPADSFVITDSIAEQLGGLGWQGEQSGLQGLIIQVVIADGPADIVIGDVCGIDVSVIRIDVSCLALLWPL